jgi:protein-disulfide isomerase
MKTILEENPGQVAWVYRHFPITERHPRAAYQAEALECAGEIGGNDTFWKYTDTLYMLTNSNNSFPDEGLTEIAREVGLDVVKFDQCLKSGKYKAKVLSQLEEGQKAGVQGTPHSFIVKDGKVIDIIPGAQPIEFVRQKVKEALRN